MSFWRWLSAAWWNREIIDRRVAAINAVAGVNVRLTRIRGRGTLVDISSRAGWQHPWQTLPAWDPAAGRWSCTVKPGFVNGVSPLVESVDLLDTPAIPLRSWRAIPADGLDPIPPFFKALGVRAPLSEVSVGGSGALTIDLTQRDISLPPRLLVACDVYLAQARVQQTSTVTAVDATGASGLVVDYATGLKTTELDRVGSRPRLLTGLYQAAKDPSLSEILLGLDADDGTDRHPISTVFLLSPENALAGSTPDGTWTPYVRHATFWNLCHAPRNVAPPKPPPPIRLFTGLALGLGDAIANQTLAPVNELAAILFNVLNARSNRGIFWSI